MTDIPRGPGGDGSPQLDLDALVSDYARETPMWNVDPRVDVPRLVALVRRLQQENEDLRDRPVVDLVMGSTIAARKEDVHDSLHVLGDPEHVALLTDELGGLRGRVEELTEALRALMAVIDGPVEWGSWRGIATGTDTPAFMQARRLLARVVPEKETP